MRKGTVRDMKKNVLLRGLFGIPTGIAIGYVITVMMSAFWGDGSYYAAYWMERSVAGVLGYIVIFCAIFVGIWIFQYLGWRAKINRINKKIALDK